MVSESAMVVVGLVWPCGGLAVIIFWCEVRGEREERGGYPITISTDSSVDAVRD